MNNPIEFNGAEMLPIAAECILENSSVGMVVVREVVEPEFLSDLTMTTSKMKMLYDSMPDLKVVDDIVSNWWNKNGPGNYTISPHFQLSWQSGIKPDKSSPAHIDAHTRFERTVNLVGGLTISLSGGLQQDSYAEFWAKAPKRQVINSSKELDGELWARQLRRSKYTHVFPEKALIKRGDAVLIKQIPRPAVHKVRSYNFRSARLLDYPITRK